MIEDFTAGTGFLIFGYGGFTLTCTSNCSAHCLPSLSARRGLSFSLMSCLHVACDAFANLTLKNGGLYFPFSTSNCAIRCHDLLHMSNLHGSSLLHRVFYHHLTLRGCDLNLANLIAKNGSWNLPFLASNCDIRCYTWLYSCFVSGLNLVALGFYHICNHLSVTIEFWSWISSTLTLDGFHCPLRLTNWVSLRNLSLFTCHGIDLPSELLYLFARKFSAILCMACSWLVFLTCVFPIDTCLSATSVHRSDDSTHESPLPLLATCTHSTFSIDVSLLTSTCILSIDTCLGATCVLEFDGSTSECPLSLLTTCAHSTFSTVACLLFGILSILIVATCLDAHGALGLDDFVYNSPLPTASTSSTLAFAIAIFHDIIVNLICITCKNSLASMSCLLAACREQIGMMVLRRQFNFRISLDDIDSSLDIEQSIQATCTSPRLDFTDLSSGWDLKSPPLPSSVTIMTTQIAEEDALTWASNINSEESSPLNSTNSPHCSDDSSAACTFLTTFTPSFHHTECPDEDGFLPPIVDTGATHCLLPLRWMTNEQAGSCKKIHLHVASGSKVRALLHDNIIYCATVTRPLITVGQMKSMLDLRFVWNDSSPLLLACSGGLKYVLLEATIFHNLPVITSHEMMTLLEAVHTFTATGSLWNAATWSKKLGHKLPLYHWSAPSHPIHLPHDDAAFTDDPQVTFSSMDAVDLLEAAIGDTPPLLSSSSQVVPLQLSSSSSDPLPSSSVITLNIADHDPPTQDEQPKKEKGAAHKNGSSQSHDSLGSMQGKVRRRTRRRRTGQSSFTNSTLSTDVTFGSSTMDIAFTTEKSTDHLDSTDCLTLDVTLPPLQLTMRVCNLQFVSFLITDFRRLVRGQM